MQSTDAGPPKKRRHYATRACNGCRRRRGKCDEVHPTCGACAFYGHQCSWSREDDARRPATKQLVDTLRTKIQVLEAEVARLQVQKGPGEMALVTSSNMITFSTRNQGELVPMQLLRRSSNSDSFLNSSQRVMTNTSSTTSYVPLSSQSDTLAELPYIEDPPTQVVSRYVSQPIYQYIFHVNASAPDGDPSEGTRLSLACDWSHNLPSLGDVRLSRHEHDLLLQRFFNYQTVWLLPLIPEVFLHDLLYSNTYAIAPNFPKPYYSPLLHCSLLAFATAFSDDPLISSAATRSKFAARAKQLLDDEFTRPTPSMVQALAILAEYCCGIGERNAGYMYLGMSIRVIQAIGLLPQSQFGTSVLTHPSPETMIHGWNAWSLFAQDKLMALEYSRNYNVVPPQSGTKFPVVDPEFDDHPWPCQLPPHTPTAADTQRNRTTLVFYESCKLMVIIARITGSIYCHPDRNDTPEDSTVINLHLQLDTWFNQLPRALLISVRSASAPLPHVIMVNICYWWSLMYLYRPFYQPDQTPGQINHDSRFTDLSIKMCDRAAHKIVQLIRIFEQSHGLRYFPRNMLQTIVACGTTLLLQGATVSESATKKRSTAQEGVNSCIRALREIASTWPYARQLAEQLEDSLSEQSHNSPISSPSAAPPSTSKVLAEQGSDDQDAPNTFYRFVHESGRDELESPYNSGICSQNSSPMPPSAYAVLGKPPGDPFGPVGWEQLFRSTSPLSRHSVSTTHPPDNLFFDKGRE